MKLRMQQQKLISNDIKLINDNEYSKSQDKSNGNKNK